MSDLLNRIAAAQRDAGERVVMEDLKAKGIDLTVQSDEARDAVRYRRLRLLGCAPCYSACLANGLVLRFTNLDEYLDMDIQAHPSRGEAP